MPKAHVWGRISAQLHPVPYLRIAAWSTAAAAAIALLMVVLLNGGTADKPGQGLAFATHSHAFEGLDARKADAANASQHNGSPSAADQNAAQDASSIADAGAAHAAGNKAPRTIHPPKNPHDPDKKQAWDDFPIVEIGESHRNLRDVHPHWNPTDNQWPDELTPDQPASMMPSLAEIDRVITFNRLLKLTEAEEAMREPDGEGLAEANRGMRGYGPLAMAQVGANITPGSLGSSNNDAFMSDQLIVLSENATPELTGLATNGYISHEPINEYFQTPLVLGAKVDLRIAKVFAVGAGLAYTRLQSYADVNVGPVSQHVDITRQYLGFAASGTYSHVLGKPHSRAAAYLSGGLQYDLGLTKHSQLVTNTPGFDIVNENQKAPLGNQASVNTALGLRYRIVGPLSLYAQGTAAHYFYITDPNLFSQKPIWPSMQVGLRIGL